MVARLRQAKRAGAVAELRHRLFDEPRAANPFRAGTKSARFWALGAEQAARIMQQLDGVM